MARRGNARSGKARRYSQEEVDAINRRISAGTGSTIRSPWRDPNVSRSPPPVIPFLRQPDNITCGPTCIAMVARAVEAKGAKLSPKAIGEFAGTNERTGTTEVEMARGLTFAGLSWRRGNAKSLEELRDALSSGDIVILRTLMGGMKHWVLVSHVDGDSFGVICPSLGPNTWGGDALHDRWAARDYDHFLVPSKKMAHEYRRKPIHEQTFANFCKRASILREADFGDYERNTIEAAAVRLAGSRVDPLNELLYQFDGYRFFRGEERRKMLVTSADDLNCVVGGIDRGTTWVDPAHRGQGLGAAIIIAAHEDVPHVYLHPSHFSELGYRARVRAHAMAIETALNNGVEVMESVIKSNPMLSDEAPAPRYRKRSSGYAQPDVSGKWVRSGASAPTSQKNNQSRNGQSLTPRPDWFEGG